ncbi:MAG TPA: ABC transporter permease [Candidatus Angelobacter sp.]|nr:ABC transporter permease [Candidatus Angelobacter sp.]
MAQLMTDSFRRALNRVRAFLQKNELDRELETELAVHMDLAVEENIRSGMSRDEALRQAYIRLGGLSQAKERQREARGLPWLEIVLQDLRYALRGLRRDKAFAFVAILILALGVGANIAVFSVVNTVLVRPLPFHDPDRLVQIASKTDEAGLADLTYTVDTIDEFKAQNHSFEDITGYFAYSTSENSVLTGRSEPRPVTAISVAGNFFPTLGVQPLLGRLFTAEEYQKNGRPAALLAHAYWRSQFNADPAIVGKAITLDGDPVTVVGVLPETFDFGSVFKPGAKIDLFVPVIMEDLKNTGNSLTAIGRLRSGVSLAQAQAEADALFPHIHWGAVRYPTWFVGPQKLMTLKDAVAGKLRRPLVMLWSAVGLVLLIVCVNISNLLLARSAARNKEFAMRAALGASRGRLIGQFLTESMCLATAGAVLGLGLACLVTSYLAHQGSLALPLLSGLRIDASTLAWTLFVSVLCAFLFGLVPAFKVSSGNLQDALKAAGPGLTEGRKHGRIRSILVVSEVALACILLIGAGLLLRSFLRVLDIDLGFQPSRALALKIEYDPGNSPATRTARQQEILQRISALPGVESAGIADNLPLERNRRWGLQAKGRIYKDKEDIGSFVFLVSPGYVNAIGMRLREGRDFNWQDNDNADSAPVVIVSESAARRHWPGQDPIGRMALIAAGKTEARVIGVFSDVRETSVEATPGVEMCLAAAQWRETGRQLVIRSALPPETLGPSVMQALRSLNPGQPNTELRTIRQIVDRAVSPRRFFALLVSIFAGLGLLLASLGIYGVISYSVARQTQEIGTRMALGATAGRVQRGVIENALRLTLIGIVVGTAASFGVARLIASLLFGTAPTDLGTFLTMIALLIAVALLAGYLPARRASRISPMIALRNH